MKLFKILTIFFVLVFSLSGCIIQFNTKQKAPDGGVWQSTDNGNKWQPIANLMNASGKGVTFQGSNINFLMMDPIDNQAFYAGASDGLYYFYGQGWQRTLANLNVSTITINPKNHCQIFAGIDNKIYRSDDCARHWDYTLIETSNDKISAIAIDDYNPDNLFVGTAGNGLFKSEDNGNSWRNLKVFNSPIKKIMITPSDTRIMYVATTGDGIYKTTDSGQVWLDITEKLRLAIADDNDNKFNKDCGNVKEYRNLIFDPQDDKRLLLATNCLHLTTDQGDTWSYLKLLTVPAETKIWGIAISYKNNQEIYYTTNTTLNITVDNGQTWSTKQLPSARTATYLLTDPVNPDLLYLSVNNFK